MKTTVEIPDALFRRAKQHCSKHGIAFRALIETGLRTALDPHKPATPFRLKPFGFKGDGPLTHDWPTILDLAYEGRGGSTDSTRDERP